MLITSIMPRILNEEAGDGANAGGGSGGSMEPTGDTGGDSGQAGAKSIASISEDGGAGNTGESAGDAGESSEPSVVGQGTFYEGLEEGLFTDPSLKPFLDGEGNLKGKDIIKSYVHAKRQLGRNKITIPGENATDDERREVAVALGLPDRESYKMKPKADGIFTDEFLDKFHDKTYENNILPHQAQGLLDWYADEISEMDRVSAEQQAQQNEEDFNSLQKEWGEAYDRNFLMASKAFKQFATPEQLAQIEESGLGTNVTLQRIFYNVAKNLNEDTFQGDSLPKGVLSPIEAKREIEMAMSDPKGPYLNAEHPNHDQEVQRIQKLFVQVG